jgi:hypothetical protein
MFGMGVGELLDGTRGRQESGSPCGSSGGRHEKAQEEVHNDREGACRHEAARAISRRPEEAQPRVKAVARKEGVAKAVEFARKLAKAIPAKAA